MKFADPGAKYEGAETIRREKRADLAEPYFDYWRCLDVQFT